MASFDPRELLKQNNDDANEKYPLERVEPTLRTSLKVVIPMNIARLRKHKNNIEKYAYSKQWKELHVEQINATRTVQQLKATIRELENIKHQIQDEDLNKFLKLVDPMKEQSLDAIKEFALLQDLISVEVQNSLKESQNEKLGNSSTSSTFTNIPLDPDDSSQNNINESFRTNFPTQSLMKQLKIDKSNEESSKELAACQSWDELREGLVELNGLVTDFATLVNEQQETVDHIEQNIEAAQEDVHSGAQILAQASKYKSLMYPVGGAILGGIVGGPIGMLAGFKIAGVAAAVGGGVVGYQGGKMLKKRHTDRVELELTNLSKKD